MTRERCQRAAFLIASDRVSRFLPSTAASLVFLIQISAGFWKTLSAISDTYDGTNPVSAGLNRAPHNIAFGTLFFWLPFVVLLTAFVGGSQTSHLIPRVLEDFRHDLERSQIPPQSLPGGSRSQDETRSPQFGSDSEAPGTHEAESFPDLSTEMDKRWSCGGLPVWQVEKFRDFTKSMYGKSHRPFAWLGIALALTVVAIPTGCAMAVSWLTPTEGFGCRALTQASFLAMWILNAFCDWILFLCARRPRYQDNDEGRTQTASHYLTIYWITFAKDLCCLALTIYTLTWTSLGVFNRCDCWCKWPRSSGYISFLQDDFIFHMIKERLRKTFPIIIACAIFSQLVIFAGVSWIFRAGYRVLKQRDIDSVLESRTSFWRRLRRRPKGTLKG